MTNPHLILAHDLGTTGNKATLFDADGALLGSAFAGYPTAYEHPNWAEQNPADWWRAVGDTTHQLLQTTGADPTAIAAVSFSGQMMGCLPVDVAGRPLRPCIIWADQRAQAEAQWIQERYDAELIYTTTGHRVSAAYTLAKVLWLRRNQPEIYAQMHKLLLPKDYLAFCFTGRFVTDYSDASGTLMFDLLRQRWATALLNAVDLPEERLPALHRAIDVIGEVTPDAAAATGLAAGTPVVIGGGDGSCAATGAGVIDPGQAYCYIGSSSWISLSTAQPLFDPAQRTFNFSHLHPERFTPTGTMQSAGGARDWAWGVLAQSGATTDHSSLDEQAAAAPPGAGGLLFLPYLLGERSPHWNPLARGAFVGLAMPHSRAEMARAVLEGVAFNLRLILDSLRSQVADITAIRLIGGGSQSALWPQILADAFNLPIHLLELKSEATSWGAAVAGGVAVGLFDWTIAAQRSQVVAIVEPRPQQVALYAELVALFAESYDALTPIYDRLARLAREPRP